jgi:hypothetical protein
MDAQDAQQRGVCRSDLLPPAMVRINFEVGGGTKHFLNERMLPKAQAKKAKPDKWDFFLRKV